MLKLQELIHQFINLSKMKYLEKIIPIKDKLKHFYIGTLAFLILSIVFAFYASLILVFIGAVSWEIYHKITKGRNDLKEMAKDVFFTCLSGLIFTLLCLI